jgi:hypothetical protein
LSKSRTCKAVEAKCELSGKDSKGQVAYGYVVLSDLAFSAECLPRRREEGLSVDLLSCSSGSRIDVDIDIPFYSITSLGSSLNPIELF